MNVFTCSTLRDATMQRADDCFACGVCAYVEVYVHVYVCACVDECALCVYGRCDPLRVSCVCVAVIAGISLYVFVYKCIVIQCVYTSLCDRVSHTHCAVCGQVSLLHNDKMPLSHTTTDVTMSQNDCNVTKRLSQFYYVLCVCVCKNKV